jgi:glycosyltransferase involved in cell wall biosynthesis
MNNVSFQPNYVLVTPARNEAAFIEQTIKSVIIQTIVPLRWVIVSDGSTDGTDELVKKYIQSYPWIELVRMPERKERHFAGKVYAFRAGYERLQHLSYDFIVSLDADITFDAGYFEFIFEKFSLDSTLGLAGTPFREGESQYDYRFSRKEHVSGACQVFRRKCFEDIGGYVPLKAGAIDLTAVVTARMKGWKTQTFTEKVCYHHRKMGSAKHNFIRATFKSGFYDYPMGVHPLWQLFRSLYQMTRKPYFFGGFFLLIGYIWALTIRARVPVSKEFIRFRRKEQMGWLGENMRKVLHPQK